MQKSIKRILALLLTIIITASAIYVPVYADGSESISTVISLLAELKIMTGDQNGDLRLDDTVTRAEFTKMAVASSSFRNNVASNLSISPFYDVPYSNWAAPHVHVGVVNNLVSGYPDASFKPSDLVTYEEAITIILRVLGYSDSDFGVAWPNGQIGMANNLEITDNLSNTEIGSPMVRSDVAILFYNSLKTKMNNSENRLISVFDATIIEDVTLISTSKEDSSIPGDEVFTDNGSYKIRPTFDYSQVGQKGDLAVKDSKTVIGFFPNNDGGADEKYAVYSVLSDNIIVYKDGQMTAVDVTSGTTVYDGKNRTTFAAIKSTLEMGDVLNVKRTNGDIDYIVYQKGTMKGPYTIGSTTDWNELIGLDSSAIIMRDGKTCTISDIQAYDILYFVPQINIAFAYTTKVTGVYDKALPNKDNPTEIEVSGTTYKVEGSTAFKKLSSSGTIQIGDTVTLLLGKTNQIADVVTSTSGINTEVVGYLFETGTKSYTSSDLKEYSSYYIKLVTPNGETNTYNTTVDYKDFKNSVVRVSFSDGNAKINRVSSGNLSGTFNWTNKTLGSTKIADNISIIDVAITDKNDPSLYKKIHPSRVDGISMNSSKIIYSHKNSNSEIDSLILSDVTGDVYTYGYLTSANNTSIGMMTSGSYTYLVNGVSYSYASASSIFTVNSGEAIKLSSVSNPKMMIKLAKLDGKISVSSANTITQNGASYELASDIQVYEKTSSYSSECRMISVTDLIGNDNYTITAYYDKLPENGGRIRILIAYKK